MCTVSWGLSGESGKIAKSQKLRKFLQSHRMTRREQRTTTSSKCCGKSQEIKLTHRNEKQYFVTSCEGQICLCSLKTSWIINTTQGKKDRSHSEWDFCQLGGIWYQQRKYSNIKMQVKSYKPLSFVLPRQNSQLPEGVHGGLIIIPQAKEEPQPWGGIQWERGVGLLDATVVFGNTSGF